MQRTRFFLLFFSRRANHPFFFPSGSSAFCLFCCFDRIPYGLPPLVSVVGPPPFLGRQSPFLPFFWHKRLNIFVTFLLVKKALITVLFFLAEDKSLFSFSLLGPLVSGRGKKKFGFPLYGREDKLSFSLRFRDSSFLLSQTWSSSFFSFFPRLGTGSLHLAA